MVDRLNPYQFSGNVHVLNCIFTKGHLQITMMPLVKSKINFPFAKGLSEKNYTLTKKNFTIHHIYYTIDEAFQPSHNSSINTEMQLVLSRQTKQYRSTWSNNIPSKSFKASSSKFRLTLLHGYAFSPNMFL